MSSTTLGNFMDVAKIAEELNKFAAPSEFEIGRLQIIRCELKNMVRPATSKIFSGKTKTKRWACHYGGRSELQFNIGLETAANVSTFRHGVALSLERSQSLPDISSLFPKARYFNEFMAEHAADFADMGLWENMQGEAPPREMLGPIAGSSLISGNFIFFGKKYRLPKRYDDIDYKLILMDFDRLLPLYKYVESRTGTVASELAKSKGLAFKAGYAERPGTVTATRAEAAIQVDLMHNRMQKALWQQLANEFGHDCVGTEIPAAPNNKIDVVVRHKDGQKWFYEIKTSGQPRLCVREAVGQLLEYSRWPANDGAEKLIVVGPRDLDDDGNRYLKLLREYFNLSIEYMALKGFG